ncbi:MAG: hypothetical protein R3B06_24175 [Kofleriaceae bacterium]
MVEQLDDVVNEINAAWDVVRTTEPGGAAAVRTATTVAAVAAMEAAWARVDPGIAADRLAEAAAGTVAVYARAAAIMTAAGDPGAAGAYFDAALARCAATDQRAVIEAARAEPERYRSLAHARYLFAHDDERTARRLCKRLARGGDDEITRAARRELAAPRPLVGGGPTLWRWNGCGTGFYGDRDPRPDGSYATTQCLSLAWIPLVPIAAYRVIAEPGGYRVFAREQLSRFARLARVAVVAAVLLGLGGLTLHHYLTDPRRLARQRFDAALAIAAAVDHAAAPRVPDGAGAGAGPADAREAALAALDRVLTSAELARVDDGRAARAGAEVVRLTAALVPTPFAPIDLDQALRVVSRYQALPPVAQQGAARAAMLAALDGWSAAAHGHAEVEQALVERAAQLARAGYDKARADGYAARADALRLDIATALADTAPTEALAQMLTPPRTAALTEAAGALLARLVDAPSLLDEASAEVEAWLGDGATPPLLDRVREARDRGASGRVEATAADVTPAALATMHRARPWDQHVVLVLARQASEAGDRAAAVAQLRAVGPPGRLIRPAQVLLAQLEAAGGDLVAADAMLTALVAPRLRRFTAAGADLDAVIAVAQRRVEQRLEGGDVPDDLRRKVEAPGVTEAQRAELVMTWMNAVLEADPQIQAARGAYVALGDVVPAALELGMIKLERAGAAPAPERAVLLEQAERTFLAISGAAEGQPEFHLGLGAIYARLGKAQESEAELAKVLAQGDPTLSLAVVDVYRSIGSTSRAIEVATAVYAAAPPAVKPRAAALLGVMTDGDVSEGWYRKADQTSPFVRTALLELTGDRQRRQGAWEACGKTFVEAARVHLAMASPARTAGYNNAALAYLSAYACTGDVGLVERAVTTIDQAYRADRDNPIVIGNLLSTQLYAAGASTLTRWIDLQALKLDSGDVLALIDVLLAGPEAPAVRAALAGTAGWARVGDLVKQAMMLAPNSPVMYQLAVYIAGVNRDVAAATAAVSRMRATTALDAQSARDGRVRWESGADDARTTEALTAEFEHLTTVLGQRGLAPRTRAVALYQRATGRMRLAILNHAAATVAPCRDELVEAQQLWPALDTHADQLACLIDATALATADGARWATLRRAADAVSVAAALIAARDPLGAALQASPAWAEVTAAALADRTLPGVTDVRLAALFDNPQLTARAEAARRDPFVRARLEVAHLTDPDDPAADADLAVLGAP